MIKLNKGHIVTISSFAGFLGANNLSDYCCSKASANIFDESLRMQLKKIGSGVKTTCICPFIMDSPMFEGAKIKR